MKQLLFSLLGLLLSSTAWTQTTLNPKFEKKIDGLLSKSVPTLSCERLQQKINTPNMYLLDAREPEEYAVSHLDKAQWVGYNTFKPENVKDVPKDAIVVVYCSIGYRSEKIGEQLKKLGYTKVYNLYGGIFEWSNRAYPLVNQSEKETENVHPYDSDWGRWVERGNKTYKVSD